MDKLNIHQREYMEDSKKSLKYVSEILVNNVLDSALHWPGFGAARPGPGVESVTP